MARISTNANSRMRKKVGRLPGDLAFLVGGDDPHGHGRPRRADARLAGPGMLVDGWIEPHPEPGQTTAYFLAHQTGMLANPCREGDGVESFEHGGIGPDVFP